MADANGFEAAANHYTYRVQWSTDDGAYLGRCLEFAGLFERAPTAQQALARVEQAVMEQIETFDRVFGGEPPKALTEQNYSGRFMVRTSPALHERLVIEAAEQGVSLNQWVVQKLVDRPPVVDW